MNTSDGHERRSHRRYPVEAELRYMLARRGEQVQEGRMTNISTGGVLFESGDGIPVGTEIELLIPWPSEIHVGTRTICITGEVVRMGGKQIAVKILSYDDRPQCEEPADSAYERHLKRAG